MIFEYTWINLLISAAFVPHKIQLFVKSWSGTEDFYRFIQMIDMVPGDTMFKDVSVAQQYFHYARTTTSRLILPTSASHILTEQGIIIPDF